MTAWVFLLASNYLSWAMLCLATPRAYRQHFGVELRRSCRHVLRAGGWLAALAAYAGSIHLDGWGIGSVTACAAWMLSAVARVLLNTYRPKAARGFAFAAPAALLLPTLAPAALALVHLSPTTFFGAS